MKCEPCLSRSSPTLVGTTANCINLRDRDAPNVCANQPGLWLELRWGWQYGSSSRGNFGNYSVLYISETLVSNQRQSVYFPLTGPCYRPYLVVQVDTTKI